MLEDWFQAAEQGKTQVILALLDQGADVDAEGKYKETALMLAVRERRIETIEALLRRGADVNHGQKFRPNAMMYAVAISLGWRRGEPRRLAGEPDPRPLEMLEAAGGRYSLREAVMLGDVDLARIICDADPSIDVGEAAGLAYSDTFLMKAAEFGDLAMVDFLLRRGADVQETDDLGRTALHSASKAGQTHVIARLIDLGAKVNDGWPSTTPLSEAEQNGHLYASALLMARGAKRRLLDALCENDLELAKQLLRQGAEPDYEVWGVDDAHEFFSVRPILYAAARGNVPFVRLLLDHGAELNVERHVDDRSPLAEASRHGHLEVVRFLLQRGADVHAFGRDGLSALEWAKRSGHDSVVKELEQARA